MTDTKDKPHPLGGFGKIIDEDHALKMAKAGGVAGFAIAISQAFVVLTYYGLGATTGKPVAKIDITSLEFVIIAGVSLLLVLLFFWMSWRTYIGKGLISPFLLIGFLIYETYSKFIGGTLTNGRVIINIILLVILIAAVRANWYLKKVRKSPNPVNEF